MNDQGWPADQADQGKNVHRATEARIISIDNDK
jgi:hypothetical protein